MKIIKYGQLPSQRRYQIECSSCGTIFEFKAEEAAYHSDTRDGDYYSIYCPLCNYFHTTNTSNYIR